jgi:STE24 endopeptidase
MISRPKSGSGLALICFLLMTAGVCGPQAPTPGARPLTAMPSVIRVPPEAQPSPNVNAEMATNGYLAQIPAEARARSDAYFEGGSWLILWDFF